MSSGMPLSTPWKNQTHTAIPSVMTIIQPIISSATTMNVESISAAPPVISGTKGSIDALGNGGYKELLEKGHDAPLLGK